MGPCASKLTKEEKDALATSSKVVHHHDVREKAAARSRALALTASFCAPQIESANAIEFAKDSEKIKLLLLVSPFSPLPRGRG